VDAIDTTQFLRKIAKSSGIGEDREHAQSNMRVLEPIHCNLQLPALTLGLKSVAT